MKRIFKFLVIAVLLFMPLAVDASDKFNVVAGSEVTSGEDVNGSSILAGNNVTSNNVVNGIDMLFGNNVNYKSKSDYALIAGNNVNVLGNIENDGFIFGNLITFDSTFVANRDLVVFGNTVSLKGTINRDITLYATNVDLQDVTVLGNITIYSSVLEVNSNVQIQGVLSYNEDAKANISDEATISNVELLESNITTPTLKERVYSFFVDYAGILLVFVAMALIIPKLFERIENKFKDVKLFDAVTSLGFGAISLVFIPILFVLLITFVIGVPLAMLLLIIYIIAIWFSTIFTGYLIGLVIWKKFIKKDINILLVGLIGISIINLLTVLPIVGVYVMIINVMIGLGIVLKLFSKN